MAVKDWVEEENEAEVSIRKVGGRDVNGALLIPGTE
jgi:hypothetical protein